MRTTTGWAIARGATLGRERPACREAADPSVGSTAGVVSSVFTPVGSIAYTPCRPTVITRRRFCNSSAMAASTNGVMSR